MQNPLSIGHDEIAYCFVVDFIFFVSCNVQMDLFKDPFDIFFSTLQAQHID